MIQEEILDDRHVIKVEFHGEDYSYSAAGRYYLRIADEEREVTSAERRQYMVCLKKIFITQDRNWRIQHQNH